MAEWSSFKQRHLLRLGHEDTCLFGDATKIFSREERECLRHEDCCDAWYVFGTLQFPTGYFNKFCDSK